MLAHDTGWRYHVLTSSENNKSGIWTKIYGIRIYTHTRMSVCIDAALDLYSQPKNGS